MAGSGARDHHLGETGDAPVHCRAVDGLPGAILLLDLDDGEAHRGKADVGLLLRDGLAGIVLTGDEAGEHDLQIRILVVYGKDALLRRARTVGQREVTDMIVVVAGLLALAVGRLGRRVECRRAGGDLVAPADQHVGFVALGDMMGLVVDPLQLWERQRRSGGLRLASEQRAGGPGRAQGGDGGSAAQNRAAGEPFRDDVGEDDAGAARVTIEHDRSPVVERSFDGQTIGPDDDRCTNPT